MLWNQLPNEAKLAESLHSFKSIRAVAESVNGGGGGGGVYSYIRVLPD